MKKIILLLLLLLPFSCFAETYYTDYELIESDISEYRKETDELKRTSKRLYNTYKEERESIGYKSNCKNKDELDFKREINITNSNNLYQSLYNDNEYIYSANIYTVYNEFRLYDINVYDGEKKIPFYISGTTLKDIDKLRDNNKDTYIDIVPGNVFVIKLDNGVKKDYVHIEFVTDKTIKVRIGIYYSVNSSKVDSIIMEANNINFVTKDEFDNLAYFVGKTKDGYLKPVGEDINYTYNCYQINKVPTGNYILSGDNIIKEDYYDLYTYYKRDKVVLSDEEINITNYDLNKLIKYSSIPVKNIETNIDYSKSGKYLVWFIFDDNFVIEKEVNVKVNNGEVIISENKNKNKTKIVSKKKKSNITTTKEIETINEEEIISAEPLINKLPEEKKKINILWLIPLSFLLLICVYNLHRLLSKK